MKSTKEGDGIRSPDQSGLQRSKKAVASLSSRAWWTLVNIGFQCSRRAAVISLASEARSPASLRIDPKVATFENGLQSRARIDVPVPLPLNLRNGSSASRSPSRAPCATASSALRLSNSAAKRSGSRSRTGREATSTPTCSRASGHCLRRALARTRSFFHTTLAM